MHAGDARHRPDPVVETWEKALALTLEIVGRAGKHRLAGQRVAPEAHFDTGNRRLAHFGLRPGFEGVDEGLALAERAMADPAGQQGGAESDEEFGEARHAFPNNAFKERRQPQTR